MLILIFKILLRVLRLHLWFCYRCSALIYQDLSCPQALIPSPWRDAGGVLPDWPPGMPGGPCPPFPETLEDFTCFPVL